MLDELLSFFPYQSVKVNRSVKIAVAAGNGNTEKNVPLELYNRAIYGSVRDRAHLSYGNPSGFTKNKNELQMSRLNLFLCLSRHTENFVPVLLYALIQ